MSDHKREKTPPLRLRLHRQTLRMPVQGQSDSRHSVEDTLYKEARADLCTLTAESVSSANAQTALLSAGGALAFVPHCMPTVSCRMTSQNLPCATLLVRLSPKPFQGCFWQHSRWTIPWRRAQKPGPTPDSAITSCVTWSWSLSFPGLRFLPWQKVGLGDHWDVGPRFTSLGVTTSPGTFGKFPNSEPQFPNQSNVVLNQKIRQKLFNKPILSVPYSHSQNSELAIIVKNQKALHKNLDLKLLLLKKGKARNPGLPFPNPHGGAAAVSFGQNLVGFLVCCRPHYSLLSS